MSDIKFVNGLFVKPPHENAPDFVKCKISIKRQELIEWLQGQSGEWVNIDVKEKKDKSKWIAYVDEWQPSDKKTASQGVRQARESLGTSVDGGDFSDDVPFNKRHFLEG